MTATDTRNTANKSVKRKHLILSDKLDVIAYLEKGKPASLIALSTILLKPTETPNT